MTNSATVRLLLLGDLHLSTTGPAIPPACLNLRTLDVEDLFAEPFGDELRDTRLPRPAGSGDDSCVGWFSVRDGLEDAREVVDFGVAMLNFPRDEPGPENASIADHLYLAKRFSAES